MTIRRIIVETSIQVNPNSSKRDNDRLPRYTSVYCELYVPRHGARGGITSSLRYSGIWIRRSHDTLMTPLTINRQRASAANARTDERTKRARHTGTYTCTHMCGMTGKSRRNRLIGMLRAARMRVKTRDTRAAHCERVLVLGLVCPHRCFINETVKLGREGNPYAQPSGAKINIGIESFLRRNCHEKKI